MSEITEAKLYEAFGLTPTEQGAQGQEIAEPAADADAGSSETDMQEQPTEEPEEQEADAETGAGTEPDADSDNPEEEDEQTDEGTGKDKQPLTAEQRRANAARRRAQEQQAAVDAAVQAEQLKSKQMVEQVLALAGLKDPVTGEPITTLEGFQKWGEKTADAKLQQDLKAGKLTKEALDQLISAHPAVQQAQQLQTQAQEQQAQQKATAERNRIADQLAKIGELNPEVKSLADILAMDTAPAFRQNVAKGMDFYDAYLLANMDAMAEDKARRAVQAAQDKSRGKEHLRAAGNARGSGAASVPHDQMKLYRMMNPNMTDAQIRAHYNKYLKQGG